MKSNTVGKYDDEKISKIFKKFIDTFGPMPSTSSSNKEMTCRGCLHCNPKGASCFKQFLKDCKNPDIIVTNDRVIWDNLQTEVNSLFKADKKWVEDMDFLSFLEFTFDAKYLSNKGSNISVFGFKVLAELVKDEDYFAIIKSHNIFVRYAEIVPHILRSVYLQSGAFMVMKALSSHCHGTLWIINSKMLRKLINPALFMNNEFMQKDAAVCVSSLWCDKGQSLNAEEWVVAHFRELIEKNNVRLSEPKDGFDVLSIINVIVLIVEENYKKNVDSSRLFALLREFKFDPFKFMGNNTVGNTQCHRFSFIQIMDQYAARFRELIAADNNTSSDPAYATESRDTEQALATKSKKVIQVDAKGDQLLTYFTYAILQLGLHIDVIEKSIDLYQEIDVVRLYNPSKTLRQYDDVIGLLLIFHIIPISGVLQKIKQTLKLDSIAEIDCYKNFHEAVLRQKEVMNSSMQRSESHQKMLNDLTLNYHSFIYLNFDRIGCRWATRIMNALIHRCRVIPAKVAICIEAYLIEILLNLYHTWHVWKIWPAYFMESLFKLLNSLFVINSSDLFIDSELAENSVLAIIFICQKMVNHTKVVCHGLDLVTTYFENREFYGQDEFVDMEYYLDIFPKILAKPQIRTEAVPGIAEDQLLNYYEQQKKNKSFLDHPEPEVRLATLKIVKAVADSEIGLDKLIEWLMEHGIFNKLLLMISDPDSDVIACVINIFALLTLYDEIWEVFLPKNITRFCAALMAEGHSDVIREASVHFAEGSLLRRHYWFIDLDRYFVPAIQLGTEDEHEIVRVASLYFIKSHVKMLFEEAADKVTELICIPMPTPWMMVFIWISQNGYGNSIMKLYYDKSERVQSLNKELIKLIIYHLGKWEMKYMSKDNYKVSNVPLEEYVTNFKSYQLPQSFAKTQKTIKPYEEKYLTNILCQKTRKNFEENTRFIEDLIDILPKNMSNIQKYKKEAKPSEAAFKVKSIPLIEFISFLRDHERSMCNIQKNKERHFLTNIQAYLNILKSDCNLPGGADCY